VDSGIGCADRNRKNSHAITHVSLAHHTTHMYIARCLSHTLLSSHARFVCISRFAAHFTSPWHFTWLLYVFVCIPFFRFFNTPCFFVALLLLLYTACLLPCLSSAVVNHPMFWCSSVWDGGLRVAAEADECKRCVCVLVGMNYTLPLFCSSVQQTAVPSHSLFITPSPLLFSMI